MAQWQTWIVAALCIVVTGSDLYARRVPNTALLVALCLGTVALCIPGSTGTHGGAAAGAGLAAGLLVFFPLYLLRWMGAGDVKFLATLGFLLGPLALGWIWLVSVPLLLAHMVLARLAQRLSPWLALQPALDMITSPHSPLAQARDNLHTHLQAARGTRRGAPYAAHLGIATLVLLASGRLA